jgi:DNA-binding transcriptional LysR family regulator
MGQYDFNSAKLLLSVVQSGSFRKAANLLGVPKSNVSRKISELEATLGSKLLNRTTRALSLTDAGRAFAKHAELALQHLDGAERAVAELQKTPQGQLRVAATVPLGQILLSSLISDFMRKYPEVEVLLHLSNREVDLVTEQFDVAIRTGDLSDSTLVKKLIGKSAYCLVASPAYLKEMGRPRTPEDLTSHQCLRFSPHHGELWSQWSFRMGKTTREIPVTGRFIANDFSAIREAAISDAGIARLPLLLVKEPLRAGKLVSVLDSYVPRPNPIHLVHPGGRNLPTKTRAFIDFVHPRLSRAFQT